MRRKKKEEVLRLFREGLNSHYTKEMERGEYGPIDDNEILSAFSLNKEELRQNDIGWVISYLQKDWRSSENLTFSSIHQLLQKHRRQK